MKYCFYYRTIIGLITIIETNYKISNIVFENEAVSDEIEVAETSLIRKCYLEINEYLNGKRINFDIELLITGTEFEKLVYQELLKIEYGQVVSYKEIAKRINKPLAYRAVGNACNHNAIPIIIPCHRVIGKNNKLTGYAGGLEIKQYLLDVEKVKI